MTITDLAHRHSEQRTPRTQLRQATIRTVPDGQGRVMVTFDREGPRDLRGPVPGAAPRPGGTMPAVGDLALVAASDTGQLWILAWGPA